MTEAARDMAFEREGVPERVATLFTAAQRVAGTGLVARIRWRDPNAPVAAAAAMTTLSTDFQ